MIDRLTALCFIGCVCLAGILSLESRSDPAERPAPPERIVAPAGPLAARVNEPTIKQWAATALERPLFSPTRRPSVAEEGARADAPLDDLRLTGILVMPDLHVAIFAKAGEKPLVGSEGDMLSDWRIDNIAAQSVSLSGPAGTTTLELRSDPNLARAQPTAVKPAQPSPAPIAAMPPSAATANAPVLRLPLRRSE